MVTMDSAEDVEDEEDIDEDDAHARAQREMACSTPAEMAPSRPRKTDEAELEDELEETVDSGRGVLGGDGGSPRYMSLSSSSALDCLSTS